MTVLKAIVKDGKIELEAPGDWPEGTEVRIEPISLPGSVGIRDEDWPDSPEGIARLLGLMDRIEPLDLTADEEAAWIAARTTRKDLEKARFDDQARSLGQDWE